MDVVGTRIPPSEPYPSGTNSRLPYVDVAGAPTQEALPLDTEVIINGVSFHVNKLILGRESPYLGGRFLTGENISVTTPVSRQCVEALIYFLRSGNIAIYDSDVDVLMQAATLLDFPNIRILCCQLYYELLHPESCIRIRKVALENNCERLSREVDQFIDNHFRYLVYVRDFYLLPEGDFIDIIRSGTLNVSSEEEVLEAVLLWINVDVLNRGDRAIGLLEHVRLPTISSDYLQRRVCNNPAIIGDPECRVLLDRATRFQRMFADERGMFREPFYTPRESPTKFQYVIVVGGEDETANDAVSTIEHFDCKKRTWQLVCPSPKRIGMAVIIHRHYLWIVGGRDDIGVYNRVDLLNFRINSWEIGPAMTKSRCDHAIALLDGMLFVVGGFDGHKVLKTTECYDRPMGEQWIADAPMKFERSEFGLCAVGEGLFAVGGWGQYPNVHLRSVEHYSLKTKNWTVVSHMSHERRFFGTGVIGGLIYVVGGDVRNVDDDDIGNVAGCDITNVAGDDIGNVACDDIGNVACDDIGNVAGGDNTNVAEVYNTTTGQWKEIKNTRDPRRNPGIGVIDGRLYAIGGEDGSDIYQSFECYLPEVDFWTVQVEMMHIKRSGAGITSVVSHVI